MIGLKYRSLSELLRQDPQAKAYFNQLPDYVREHIASRSDSVNSLASLKDYAENLTRGEE